MYLCKMSRFVLCVCVCGQLQPKNLNSEYDAWTIQYVCTDTCDGVLTVRLETIFIIDTVFLCAKHSHWHFTSPVGVARRHRLSKQNQAHVYWVWLQEQSYSEWGEARGQLPPPPPPHPPRPLAKHSKSSYCTTPQCIQYTISIRMHGCMVNERLGGVIIIVILLCRGLCTYSDGLLEWMERDKAQQYLLHTRKRRTSFTSRVTKRVENR